MAAGGGAALCRAGGWGRREGWHVSRREWEGVRETAEESDTPSNHQWSNWSHFKDPRVGGESLPEAMRCQELRGQEQGAYISLSRQLVAKGKNPRSSRRLWTR